jgi:hypothetical protein
MSRGFVAAEEGREPADGRPPPPDPEDAPDVDEEADDRAEDS